MSCDMKNRVNEGYNFVKSTSLKRFRCVHQRRHVYKYKGIGVKAQNESIDRTQPKGTHIKLLGGKGGVGKTTLASSLAVSLAKNTQKPTLIVSTDPAHSLSDALGQDVSGGKPVQVDNLYSATMPLWAMEIDPSLAKEEITSKAKEQKEKGSNPLKSFGMILQTFGINVDPEVWENLNISELLNTPPPGFDEILAIAKIMDFVVSKQADGEALADTLSSGRNNDDLQKFENIVIDTAPTGHTLRLLSAPEFLDRSLEKLLAARRMLDSASNLVKSLFSFGQTDANDEKEQRSLVERMEDVQIRLRAFSKLLRDESSSEFIVVTIPTQMAVSETTDLAASLKAENIPIKRCVVNQVFPASEGDSGIKLAQVKQKDQMKALESLKNDKELSSLEQLKSPLLDLEVRGVPALQYFGNNLWKGSTMLEECVADREQRFVILGGKGGVGKTTSSASLALSFAQEGHTVLVVSTDPAHSLGDSLDQEISSGKPVLLEGSDLPVWAMEIDPSEAMEKLRNIIKDADIEEDSVGAGESQIDLGAILRKLQDLKLDDLLENPPPGTDEAIAIAKVVQFAKDPEFAKFTRIVIDTAPTGHTLRLLTLPAFVSLSIDKILKFRSIISQVAGKTKGEKTIEKLTELQVQMEDAQELLHDSEKTEFVIVTIPTYLSIAESSRLIKSLKHESVKVRHIVINQLLDFGEDDKMHDHILRFMSSKIRDQEQALALLKTHSSTCDLEIIESPVINMEVRGVPALEYFSSVVWQEENEVISTP